MTCVPVLSGVTNQPFVLCTFVVRCVLCICVVRCDQSPICPVYLCCHVWPINHFVLCTFVVRCVSDVLSDVTNQPFVLCTCVVRCDKSTICPVLSGVANQPFPRPGGEHRLQRPRHGAQPRLSHRANPHAGKAPFLKELALSGSSPR